MLFGCVLVVGVMGFLLIFFLFGLGFGFLCSWFFFLVGCC